MGEVTSNGVRNFGLNMSPGLDSVTSTIIDDPMILDDWSFDDDPMILDDLPLTNSGNGSELQAGEGNVAAEVQKANEICKDGVSILDKKTSEKNGGVEKGDHGSNDGGFFNCNICLDMAKDPVVTCCGHLFCWPCIYRWLDMKSTKIKGCPVCKGKVTIDNVTPIYGCGKEKDSNLNIPLRPNAKRLDNAGQSVERLFRSKHNMVCTEIHGRGEIYGHDACVHEKEKDSNMNIPLRPNANVTTLC